MNNQRSREPLRGRKNILGIFVGLFLILNLFGFVGAVVTIHKIPAGLSLEIDAYGVSKEVSNGHSTLAIMVPTGSSLEWSEFRANAPSFISMVDPGCTTSSDCSSGYYCHTGGDCLNLPLCAEANTGTGYNAQESTEDLWNDCNTANCNTGNCAGGSYTCGYYTSEQHNCQSGYACNGDGLCEEELVCFISETKILMSDGTYEDIVNVQKGKFVRGETQLNEVLGMQIHDFSNDKLYSINGGKYFVAAEHPFKTITGWKAINPKKLYEEDEFLFRLLDPKVLKVGDILLTEDGLIIIESIGSKYIKKEMKVYNLMLEGDHTYYADGYLVHNNK